MLCADKVVKSEVSIGHEHAEARAVGDKIFARASPNEARTKS